MELVGGRSVINGAYPVDFLLESSLIGQQNETFGAIRPPFGAKEPPTAEAS